MIEEEKEGYRELMGVVNDGIRGGKSLTMDLRKDGLVRRAKGRPKGFTDD